MLIQAEAALFVIYEAGQEQLPMQWMEKTISFTGELPLVGCRHEMIPSVEPVLIKKEISIHPDEDGENRIFHVEAVVELDMKLYLEEKVHLLCDAYSTTKEVCCAGLLRACGNALTPKAAQAYLAGFQDVLPLETAELALLVPGLQAAVVCALAESYAGDGAAAPALFTSLRALGTAAWGMLAERCDRVGRILARDPAGVYPTMDAATRTRYRQTVARLARRTGRTEIDIAEDVLARAQRSEGARRHVGWFLLREVLGAPERRRDGGWYIAAVVVGALFLSLLLGFATKSVSGAVLLLIPVSEVVKGLLDAVLLRVTKPRFVPRLALRRGIPPEGRTLCVIAALLTSPDDVHALCARLEEYYLCNRDALGQLTFGLLADLPEADMAHAPIDPAILRAARAEIAALNARWGSRFYLFTRPRVQTPDGKWSAWERKRGALLELARLVLDRPGTLQCAAGDAAGLSGTVYLLTLDADTRLTPGLLMRTWMRECRVQALFS